MSAARDLHTQMAERLFGWRWEDAAQLWRDQGGVYSDVATFRRRLPAYSTSPAATALVWQWLEAWRDLQHVTFDYWPPSSGVTCEVLVGVVSAQGGGATWSEALCRAALALAEALEPETG